MSRIFSNFSELKNLMSDWPWHFALRNWLITNWNRLVYLILDHLVYFFIKNEDKASDYFNKLFTWFSINPLNPYKLDPKDRPDYWEYLEEQCRENEEFNKYMEEYYSNH